MSGNWEEEWKKYNDKICSRVGWIGATHVVAGDYLNVNN